MNQNSNIPMQDKDMMEDALSSQKFITGVYNTFANECNEPNIRNEMLNILNDEHHIQADIMDGEALDSLGLRNFDVVVISIKKVEISCLVTMAIKDRGAKFVVAQASSEGHAKILERIGADKVIMPEKDMGLRVARSLAGGNVIDYMELSSKHSLIEINTPQEWAEHTLKENNLRNRFGINVVAIRSDASIQVSPKGDDVVRDGDVLVVIGENADLDKLTKYTESHKH